MNSSIQGSEISSIVGDGHHAASNRVEKEILIFGFPIRFCVDIAGDYARLADMVPLARMVCDTLLNIHLAISARHGYPPSCRKKCTACCHYLVPLSLPEVFRLRREFSSMPADYRIPILKSCIHASIKILRQDITEPEINENTSLAHISKWYSGLDIPCPLLSDGLCSIYQQRPLACREYYVSSPPAWCRDSIDCEPRSIRMPFSISEILGTVAAELEQTEAEAVMLPLALIGTDELTERSKRMWPTVYMVRLFLDVLEKTALRHSDPLPVS